MIGVGKLERHEVLCLSGFCLCSYFLGLSFVTFEV